MTLLELMLVNLAVIGTMMLLVWLGSVFLGDVSIIDLFWGLGFIVIAGVTVYCTAAVADRTVILLVLTGLWGLRLTGYLTWRKFGTPEDHRYRAMRDGIGRHFWLISLFSVFELQAIIMILVALPLLTGLQNDSAATWLDVVGIAVWLIGFAFETIGDYQLSRFKADPQNRGQALTRGLWRYTRHPNYFGDFMVWWGIYLVSLGDGRAWWTVVSPLLMSLLLMRISGVTLLEHSLRTSKEGYQDYITRTSSFFPWMPRT